MCRDVFLSFYLTLDSFYVLVVGADITVVLDHTQ